MLLTSAIPKLTLVYFPVSGRAEPSRLAAVIGKIPFTNEAIRDLSLVESVSPLRQLPILKIEQGDGKTTVIPESRAILRYLGKLGGLYPQDPIKAAQVDAILDFVADLGTRFDMSMSPTKFLVVEEGDWNPDKTMAMRDRIVKSEKRGLPLYYKYFENILKESTSGWLVGDDLTVADLNFHNLNIMVTSGHLDGVPKDLVTSAYPAVVAHMDKIESLPAVKKWREEHPMPYGTFDYQPE